MGHARALINIEDPDQQLEAYYRILDEGLSVRATEEMIRNLGQTQQKKTTSSHRQKGTARGIQANQTNPGHPFQLQHRRKTQRQRQRQNRDPLQIRQGP
jgi:ParB-like chromosome segregation protein Spo0J